MEWLPAWLREFVEWGLLNINVIDYLSLPIYLIDLASIVRDTTFWYVLYLFWKHDYSYSFKNYSHAHALNSEGVSSMGSPVLA